MSATRTKAVMSTYLASLFQAKYMADTMTLTKGAKINAAT